VSSEPIANLRARIGIGAISGAILVQQIALTRLLSVVLWYHFAFVAISLAMLGLALGGVALYSSPRLLARTERLLPWYARLSAVATVLTLAWLVKWPPDLDGSGASVGAALLYVVLLVPFTLSGFAVSATLAFYSRDIGRLYAADLCGAALGCVVVVPLIDTLGAPSSVLVGALLAVFAGAAWASRRQLALDGTLAAGCIALLVWQGLTHGLEPTAMHGNPDHNPTTGAPPDFTGWNSHSRIVVTPQNDWGKLINIDGSATTGIYRFDTQVERQSVQRQLNWLPLRSGSMPYVVVGDEPRVLVIGPGGGLDLLNGIYYGARITAVELNGLIHGLMSAGPIAKWAGNVYTAPNVHVVHDEARSWIRRSDEKFDLIQASMIDTWAATASGAFSLAENALYTVEAFEDYWTHLSERGLVHFQRWNEAPPRQSLRVLALIAAAMRRAGVARIADHVVVLEEPMWPAEGMPMASVLWARTPFDRPQLDRLEAAVVERQKIGPVKILAWPGRPLDNALSRFLAAPDPDAYLAAYPFEVRATTDNQPFFFHTEARSGDAAAASENTVVVTDQNEQAIGVLHGVLLAVAGITLLAFVVPLLVGMRRGSLGRALPASVRLLWFASLGFGFMLVEIPLLQRFGLYLGHPTWTMSLVLGALLLGAGLGGASTATCAEPDAERRLGSALLTILAMLVALWLGLDRLLAGTLQWSFVARATVTAATSAPVGFALGRALPLGVLRLRQATPELVPWAWGINGATSVLASILAVVLALELGFAATFLVGSACYLGALLLRRRLA
jgi:spermidine synthase